MRLRQHQRVFRLAAIVLLCFCAIASASTRHRVHAKPKPADVEPTGRVTEIRFWSLGETTRIAIELNSEFQLKSDRLQNPERLFFDIVGVRPPAGHNPIETILVGDAFIKQIRVAETQPGTVTDFQPRTGI